MRGVIFAEVEVDNAVILYFYIERENVRCAYSKNIFFKCCSWCGSE